MYSSQIRVGAGNQVFRVSGKKFFFRGNPVIYNRYQDSWIDIRGNIIPEFLGKKLSELPGIIESVLHAKATA